MIESKISKAPSCCVVTTNKKKKAKYSIPKLFYRNYYYKIFDTEKVSAFPFECFSKQAVLKPIIYKAIVYSENWLKDLFMIQLTITLCTYCFKAIYTIPLFPLSSNTDFSYLL